MSAARPCRPAGRDLPGPEPCVMSWASLIEPTPEPVAGPYEPDLLPSPVMVTERINKVLCSCVDQKRAWSPASLIHRRVLQKEVPGRRCQRDHAAGSPR